ncbi:5-oxoprolinase subunit PxpA [Brooklawnia cerclae]|uniref:UPF0271 protein n=1 Tax=Brooklawnia cerclae TaxID=349934 RepID=A0ABX0SGU3_9ACTN|nr:5-oxoprolinase subunit PxpA [Brooklawnia cerclae]NIH57604.1 UPF0271 protein [Brooklawnia cerclae]
MATSVNLVADIGESFGPYEIGQDEQLLDYLSSANVACGFHGGDPVIMDRTVRLCAEKGVAVGAHPGFQDRRNFGRVTIELPPEQLFADTLYQIGALRAFTDRYGTTIHHVAPHGRLGNLTAVDPRYAEPVFEAIHAFDPHVRVSATGGSVLGELAVAAGHELVATGLPDRGYDPDGHLTNRRNPGALVTDPAQIVARAITMIEDGYVIAVDGSTRVPVPSGTILIHGDKPWALPAAKLLKAALAERGMEIRAL